jgi:ABC-type branched-subunit amino acid transport system ATPase component
MSDTAAQRPAPLLRATDVAAGYGGAPVVKQVSLDAGPGEVVLVIGPNGAGKSTLAKAVNGELRLLGGALSFAGRDIGRLGEVARAALGIGYVPQSRDVFPTLTVAENLQMGGYRLDRRVSAARVEALLARFGQLAALRRRTARQLSGGERKLLGIARALVAEPQLLMLDEPTANLSPAAARTVLHDVAAPLAAAGGAVLLIEQRVALAVEVASWVCVLVDGTVRFSGPVAQFREIPNASTLFFARARRS